MKTSARIFLAFLIGTMNLSAQPTVTKPATPNEDQIVYKIQILTANTKISPDNPVFKGLSPVSYYVENGVYKYTYGETSNYAEIQNIKEFVRSKFDKTFTVAFRNGKRLSPQEIVKITHLNQSPQASPNTADTPLPEPTQVIDETPAQATVAHQPAAVETTTNKSSGKPEIMVVDELPRGVHSKIRVSLNGGAAYRIAKLNNATEGYEQINDFFQKLRLGAMFSADIAYFFQPEWGLGVHYSIAGHSNNISNLRYKPWPEYRPNDVRDNGKLDDNIRIQFIAPLFTYRWYTYRNDAFLATIAAGYVDYHDNYTCPRVLVDTEFEGEALRNTKAASGTFGIRLGIGYDWALSENWALGVQLSGLFTTRTKEKSTIENGNTETIDLSRDKGEDNLARLELTVGLRFNK